MYCPLIKATGKPNTTGLDLKSIGDPIYDVLLQPGDLLYLPRGFPHEVASGLQQLPFQAWQPKGETSLHLMLTIPTHAYSTGKIVQAVLEDVLDENAAFRDAIPVEVTAEPSAIET